MQSEVSAMKKNLEYYVGLPYREVIEADPAGGYVGYIPELRGCITQGETKADVSLDALAVAKENTALNKLTGRVRCVQADALKPAFPFLGKFDLIVSNPPYITGQEMLELPVSVKDYEPHLALYGGEDGLDFYRAIAQNFAPALKPGGYLCFEFGMGQGDDVCQILTENGYTILDRTRDYNSRERAVLAQYGRKEV